MTWPTITLLLTMAINTPAESGIASWYGIECAGRIMANGKPFNRWAMTAASWHYPMGTMVRVTNAATGKAVVVTITDRGPHRRFTRRIIDLSRGAFDRIAETRTGLVWVRVERVRP